MMRFGCVILLGISATTAFGCDLQYVDASMQYPNIAFVGTVVGYRLDDTSLVKTLPSCPMGADAHVASVSCKDFWRRVVSVQFHVEHGLRGLKDDRTFETVTGNSDGCAPGVGERWITSGWYNDGFSQRLDVPPTAAQLEHWRIVANTEPK